MEGEPRVKFIFTQSQMDGNLGSRKRQTQGGFCDKSPSFEGRIPPGILYTLVRPGSTLGTKSCLPCPPPPPRKEF